MKFAGSFIPLLVPDDGTDANKNNPVMIIEPDEAAASSIQRAYHVWVTVGVPGRVLHDLVFLGPDAADVSPATRDFSTSEGPARSSLSIKATVLIWTLEALDAIGETFTLWMKLERSAPNRPPSVVSITTDGTWRSLNR